MQFIHKTIYSRLAQFMLLALLAVGATSCFKEVDTAMTTQSRGTVNLSPASGPKGSIINISGNDFPSDASKIQVKVNGVVAPVVSSTSNQIQARVAAGSGSGAVEVFIDGAKYDGGHFEYIYTSFFVTSLNTGDAGWLDGPLTAAKFEDLRGIAIDGSDKVYNAQNANPRVRITNLINSAVSTLAGDGTVGDINAQGVNAKLGRALDIGAAENGTVYLADRTNNKIKKIDAAGNVTTFATPAFVIEGIKVGKLGNIFVSGPNNIAKYNAAGSLVWNVQSKGSGNVDGDTSTVRFLLKGGIDINPTETKIYLIHINDNAQPYPSQIKLLDVTAGTIKTIAGGSSGGSEDGPALSAGFDWTPSIALDKLGGLWIADYWNGRVRYLKDGTVRTIIGSAGYGDTDGNELTAQVGGPWGMHMDSKGNLIFTDNDFNKLKKLTIKD